MSVQPYYCFSYPASKAHVPIIFCSIWLKLLLTTLSITHILHIEKFPAVVLRAGNKNVKPSCIHLCVLWWLASEAWNMEG